MMAELPSPRRGGSDGAIALIRRELDRRERRGVLCRAQDRPLRRDKEGRSNRGVSDPPAGAPNRGPGRDTGGRSRPARKPGLS